MAEPFDHLMAEAFDHLMGVGAPAVDPKLTVICLTPNLTIRSIWGRGRRWGGGEHFCQFYFAKRFAVDPLYTNFDHFGTKTVKIATHVAAAAAHFGGRALSSSFFIIKELFLEFRFCRLRSRGQV